MATTFTVCSWLLAALGVSVTAWLYPNPIAFVPYVLLAFAIRCARTLRARAAVLVLALGSVCLGFWYFWDAAYVHLSTMNFIPFELVVVESLVAAGVLLAVHRKEKSSHEHTDP